MQTPCSAIHWHSCALIAMKMTCCFYHVKAHGRSFSYVSLLLSLILIYPTQCVCVFCGSYCIYIRGLTRELNLF